MWDPEECAMRSASLWIIEGLWIVLALSCGKSQDESAAKSSSSTIQKVQPSLEAEKKKLIATLLNDADTELPKQGKYKQALEAADKARNLAENIHDLRSVGLALMARGQIELETALYAQAANHCLEAIRMLQGHAEAPDSNIAYLNNCVGVAYLELHENAKAIEYLEKSLAISKKVSGEDSCEYVQAFYNLAGELFEGGNYDKAMEYAEQAGRLLERRGEQKHPLNVNILELKASYWLIKGKIEKGKELGQQALDLAQEIYGQDDPGLGSALKNICGMYGIAREYQIAIRYCEKSLVISRKALGENHDDIAKTYVYLGNIYVQMAKCRESLVYYKKAMEIYKNVLGLQNIQESPILTNIGAAYICLGQYLKTVEMSQKALALSQKMNGDQYPMDVYPLSNLSVALTYLGRYSEAIEAARKAVASAEKLGPSSKEKALAYAAYGFASLKSEDPRKAVDLLVKAREEANRIYGDNDPRTVDNVNALCEALIEIGQFAQALHEEEAILGPAKNFYGAWHPYVATIFLNMGQALIGMGQYNAAIRKLKEALKIDMQVFKDGHPDIGKELQYLGVAYYGLGKYDEALRYLQRAYIMRCRFFEAHHPDVIEALAWIEKSKQARSQKPAMTAAAQQQNLLKAVSKAELSEAAAQLPGTTDGGAISPQSPGAHHP